MPALSEAIVMQSWVYKQGLQKGSQEGLQCSIEEGLKKGLEKGREEGLRAAIELVCTELKVGLTRKRKASLEDLDEEQLQAFAAPDNAPGLAPAQASVSRPRACRPTPSQGTGGSARRGADETSPRKGVGTVLVVIAMAGGCAAETPSRARPDQPAAGPTNEMIEVGSYLPLSGQMAEFGKDARTGIEMAVEEANARGGIRGRKVRLLVLDDASDTAQTRQVVSDLLRRRPAVVLGELTSSRSLVGAELAEKAGVPMVTPTASDPAVVRGRQFVFRACVSREVQALAAAEWATQTRSATRVAVVRTEGDPYSAALANAFEAALSRRGKKPVASVSVRKQDPELRSALEGVRLARPDLVYAPIFSTDVPSLATALGLPAGALLGADGWDAPEIAANPALEGASFTTSFAADAPWPKTRSFVAAYRARYERAPSATAALGYDSVAIAIEAMGRASSLEPEAIRREMEHAALDGAAGALSVLPGHDVRRPVPFVTIRAQKLMFAGEATPQE